MQYKDDIEALQLIMSRYNHELYKLHKMCVYAYNIINYNNIIACIMHMQIEHIRLALGKH